MGHQNDHSGGYLGDYPGDYVTDYVDGHVTSQVTHQVTDYVTNHVTDYVTNHVTDYATDYVSDYVADYVTNYVSGHTSVGDHPLDYQETGVGTGRHRASEQLFSTPLVPPDSGWDPAEELAFMLQDAMQEANRPKIPAAREEFTAPREEFTAPRDEMPVTEPAPGSPLDNLREITAELPPLRRLKGEAPRGHRKVRRRGNLKSIRTVSQVIAALAAVIASAVSFFGGMVSYDPLRIVAIARMETGVASWWPLLVYGPWLVASLSVLRAALHQRRAVHSWCVVLLFSSIAMLLCVLQAPRTIVDISAAALPGLASLACFQQLVRQITLTRPPRRAVPRHRLPRATPPEPQATDKPATTPKPGSPRPAPSKTSTTTPRTPGTSTRRSPSPGR